MQKARLQRVVLVFDELCIRRTMRAMSFLRRLFGASETFSSPVRKLLASELVKVQRGQSNQAQKFTLNVFLLVDSFGVSGGQPIANMKKYLSDAVLFELGCFLYARADFLIYCNLESSRNRLNELIHNRFISIFNNVIQDSEMLHELINARLSLYGELFVEGAELSTHHRQLANIINYTVKKGKNTIQAGDRLHTADALDNFQLQMSLLEWEKIVLPRLNDELDSLV